MTLVRSKPAFESRWGLHPTEVLPEARRPLKPRRAGSRPAGGTNAAIAQPGRGNSLRCYPVRVRIPLAAPCRGRPICRSRRIQTAERAGSNPVLGTKWPRSPTAGDDRLRSDTVSVRIRSRPPCARCPEGRGPGLKPGSSRRSSRPARHPGVRQCRPRRLKSDGPAGASPAARTIMRGYERARVLATLSAWRIGRFESGVPRHDDDGPVVQR